ncbi:MAG TPA: chemotaxis protein CheW [Chthoniobacter sp.]|nr:chemotaxis protein CheW [Chthoniobacter sp.]
MSADTQLLVFLLDGQRYALPLGTVERIVRAAEITPLPQAPPIVLGALDVAGTILPVLNMRRRFHLPERAIQPSDQFLLARAGKRPVALVIDAAADVIELPLTQIVPADTVAPGLEHIRGVARMNDGLILIHDLESFLSLDEAAALDRAMNAQEEVLHGA